MSGRCWTVLAAALSGALLAAACAAPPRPNVVILLMDTLRADRLGCYGYQRDTSPAIDSLAAAGARFTKAYATADYTQASTASLFTGLYPLAHGYVNADYVLPEEHQTLAEILAAQGYRTAGFIANGLAGRKYQMHQGFGHHVERNQADAASLADSVIAFLDEAAEPFFVYAHFLDVHDPHRAPAEARQRFAGADGFAFDLADAALRERMHATAWWSAAQLWWPSEGARDSVTAYFADYGRAYDGTVRYWDDQVRRIATALRDGGRDGNTVLLLTSDHGEQLLEHGFFGHASSGYEEGLRIPLLWIDPAAGVDSGVEVPATTSLVDLLPTLLDRLGLEAPPELQGRSRWPLSSATSADTVYTEGTFYRNRPFHTLIQTYRQGSWKLVLDRFRDVKELYDLDADPGEARDLFAERPEIVAELYTGLRHRYHKSLSRFMGVRAAASAPVAGDPAKERELRALGYLGGGGGGDLLEFFPLRPRAPGRYGPFGDEPELDEFQARIDFTRGRLAGDQIVAGYADEVGRRDARGVWFDRRAIFLLRGRRLGLPARVEVYVDTTGPRPSRIEAWIEGEIVSTFAIDMGGSLSFDVPLPARIAAADDWRLELRADTRFVSRTGASPRTDEHASFRVRRIYATGTNPTEGDL